MRFDQGRLGPLGFLAVVLLLATSAITSGEDALDIQSELRALKAEVARLRQQSGDTWLNERRREEIKLLVQEVLADADSRASVAGEGMTAGHDGKNFFLTAADGSFLMKVSGQLQFRWILNGDQPTVARSGDEEDEGFQIRRAKVGFAGHVDAGRKWEYKLVLAGERDDGDEVLEDFIIKTKISDEMKVAFGKYKLPFLRQELTSSSRQLSVDRGLVTEFFTLDRSEQFGIEYSGENYKILASINDGADEEFSTIGADPVEVAATARIDIALQGDLKQTKDFAAWDGEDTGIFLGGAVHYQEGDGENADNSSESDADYLAFTVDGSIESEGMSIFAAYMHGAIDADGDPSGPTTPAPPFSDRDMLGFLGEFAFFLTPNELQPFIRYEWLDDDFASDDAEFLTAGFNYYWKKHAAKLTVDVVYVLEIDETAGITSNPYGNSIFSDGLGFSGDGVDDNSYAVRAQFQLLF